MAEIVITDGQGFTSEQCRQIEALCGVDDRVTAYSTLPADADEYLQRVEGADIICSGSAGLREAYPRLRDVFVTVPFTGVGFLDLDVLRSNNVTVSNTPGANKEAVAEWTITMASLLANGYLDAINREQPYDTSNGFPPVMPGLAGSEIAILGRGNIGRQIGKLAAAYDMSISYFSRGDDLLEVTAHADVIVNALSSNESTRGLLGRNFFASLQTGTDFITFAPSDITDTEAMFAALDLDIIRVASDCGEMPVGDVTNPLYQRLRQHPGAIVTPHIAYNTVQTVRNRTVITIANIEAWLRGKPQNVVT
jgi:phosphoglycerate dehydrogenase-like enzyme